MKLVFILPLLMVPPKPGEGAVAGGTGVLPLRLKLVFILPLLMIPPAAGEHLYSDDSFDYFKMPVNTGVRMVEGATATICGQFGMKAVCPGNSALGNCVNGDECVLSPLEIDCTLTMGGISQVLCDGERMADKCDKLEGVFTYMKGWRGGWVKYWGGLGWAGSERGVVGGKWAVGKNHKAGVDGKTYAYCARAKGTGTGTGTEWVRLSSYPRGRVELYKDGQWGALCGHFWWNNQKGAENICKELGYDGGTQYTAGGGSGPILAGNRLCKGGEATVWDCPLQKGRTDTDKCGHAEDQGVECTGQRQAWTEWGNWNEVGSCSRLCGKNPEGTEGKQKMVSRRACVGTGCPADSPWEFVRSREDSCNTEDCICDTTGLEVGSFCSTEFQSPIRNGVKLKFCRFHTLEKEAALLCDKVTPAQAEELLSSSLDLPKVCNFDAEDLLNSPCGQLVQDKLDKEECDKNCQEVRQKITNTAELVEEVYSQKKKEVDVLTIIAKGQKSLAEVAKATNEIREVRNKRDEIQKELTNTIDRNTLLTQDQKKNLKEKMVSAMEFGPEIMTSYNDIIKNTKNEVRVLTNQAAKLDKSKSKMTLEFAKVKRGVKGMAQDKAGTLQKTSDTLGHVVAAVGKWQKGGTLNAIEGTLLISNAISVFLPPPFSVVTGTMSTIFSLFGGGPPSTEDVINEGFKKQKKWMTKKFKEIVDRLDEGFGKIEVLISDLNIDLTEKIRAIEQHIRLKELQASVRHALGVWETQKLKLEYLVEITNQDKELNDIVVQTMVFETNLFRNTAKNYAIKRFVLEECKEQKETDIRKVCQVLAFASLMMDKEDVKVIDQTITFIGTSNQKSLIPGRLLVKQNTQQRSKDFLKLIFTTMSGTDYSYVSCGLSDNSLVPLEQEQKQQLIMYAEHLEPGLGEELKKREACVDGAWSQWGYWKHLVGDCEDCIKRKRECNNPPPQEGGAPCLGPAMKEKKIGGSELYAYQLFSDYSFDYFKNTVDTGVRMVEGATVTACEKFGMKAVCSGPSGCQFNDESKCVVTPLETVCGNGITISKAICNGEETPWRCDKLEGLFVYQKGNNRGNSPGLVGGNKVDEDKDHTAGDSDTFAYCAKPKTG